MAQRLGEPWHLDVSQLLVNWPTKEPTTGKPIYEYKVELFASRFKAEMVAEETLSTHRLETRLPGDAADAWPWRLDPPHPTRC